MPEIANDRLTASIADIARQLGLSERTIHRLIRTGELASIKVGRRRLILRETFTRWLAGMERPTP